MKTILPFTLCLFLFVSSNAQFQNQPNEFYQNSRTYSPSNSNSNASLRKLFKKPSTGNIKLDSVWTIDLDTNNKVSERKDIYRYDSIGNLNSKIQFTKFRNKTHWNKNSKTKFLYDSSNFCTSEQNYRFDTLSQQWYVIHKYLRNNDVSNKQITDSIWYLYSNSNTLELSYYIKIDYDSNSLPTKKQYYYNYDTINHLWKNYSQTVYSYNNYGKLINELSTLLDNQTQQVLAKYADHHIYFDDTLLSTTIYKEWIDTNSQWVNKRKSKFTYDIYHNIISQIDYYYESNSWQKFYKYDYTYDINNNNSTETIYWNNNITKLWMPIRKWEYVYDNTYDYNDLILPSTSPDHVEFNKQYFNHMRLIKRHFDYDSYYKTWTKKDRHIYYYSNLNDIKTTTTTKKSIRVYPNPASNYIMFEVDDTYNNGELTIFNSEGKTVYKQAFWFSKKIGIRSLSQGVYYYSVKNENQVFTGKFIIAR